MHDPLIILFTFGVILIVASAVVWLAYRMPGEIKASIGGVDFTTDDFVSVDALIKKVTPENWFVFFDSNSFEVKKALDEDEKGNVLVQLTGFVDLSDRIRSRILELRESSQQMLPVPSHLKYQVGRLTPEQVRALRHWVRKVGLSEDNAPFLFELLKRQEEKDDNQDGSGGKPGGDNPGNGPTGNGSTGDDRPPLPNLWKWLSVWGGLGGGGGSTKEHQR